MPTAARLAVCAVLLIATAMLVGCTKTIPMPDLGERYDRTAQYHGPDRNPVIVIPGILGSKLTHPPTGTRVWGAFERSAADPGTPEGARLIALPMEMGKPLHELTDDVESNGSLDTVRLSLFGLPIELQAYAQILSTLGVGGYIDDQLGENGAIDYGTDHYSCFQFDYDWRRDNVENAHKLLEFIQTNRKVVQRNLAEDYGGEPEDYDVKFDIVAHSMGGLLTRYMLRYGDADLPEDGSTPEVTWAGAEHVDRVVLVGTPNAGAVNALEQLIEGTKFSPFHARYSPAVLGTMPSIYQLLPRSRHHRTIRRSTKYLGGILGKGLYAPLAIDPLKYKYWEEDEWGLVSPKMEKQLTILLPEVDEPEERIKIASDHLRKCLSRADAFHKSLDSSASLPDGLTLVLYAGDGVPTPDVIEVASTGVVKISKSSGDGTVTRESAVMDERVGADERHDVDWSPHLVTPIDWTDVNFLFTDHLGLTADPVFADNVLYLLLESPKRD